MENAHLIYEAVGPEPSGGVEVMVVENPYPPAFSPARQQAIHPDGLPLAESLSGGPDHGSS